MSFLLKKLRLEESETQDLLSSKYVHSEGETGKEDDGKVSLSFRDQYSSIKNDEDDKQS